MSGTMLVAGVSLITSIGTGVAYAVTLLTNYTAWKEKLPERVGNHLTTARNLLFWEIGCLAIGGIAYKLILNTMKKRVTSETDARKSLQKVSGASNFMLIALLGFKALLVCTLIQNKDIFSNMTNQVQAVGLEDQMELMKWTGYIFPISNIVFSLALWSGITSLANAGIL